MVIRLGLYVFFFFKQKTAYEMRISDWSSDVCSSDLPVAIGCASQLAIGAYRFQIDAVGKLQVDIEGGAPYVDVRKIGARSLVRPRDILVVVAGAIGRIPGRIIGR